MRKLNPDHLSSVIGIINDCPFFKHMSMRVMEIGIGYSIVAATILKNHMNPFGGLHGGVYASAIDTAAYWSAYCDLPEDKGLVSIDIKVDFIAPIVDGEILVKGNSIKAGKSIHLTEAKMFNSDGKLLAHGTSKLLVTQNKQSINDIVEYIGSNKLPEKFIRS
ncbi:PaaI family thioesterase [Desulfosarcina cetonica]|uniref:PaaI family thioesterase n=1 Tax=Desulfosarcina cetonica TaxID=90730 RepID=UPI0006D0D0F0|nr:PaaI family thioesterase [Desulfosarcina cetonica]